MFLSRRLQCTPRPPKATYPLTLLTWNIDQERPSGNARIDRDTRLEHLLRCVRAQPDVDFVLFQESAVRVQQEMVSNSAFEWVGEAQARTYNGYLQVFRSSASEWNARIAWQYTGLTFEIWQRAFQPLLGENPWRIGGSALRQPPPYVVRISNIHLDGATDDHALRGSAIKYYTRVPQSDIIVGDGQYRSGDAFPANYQDAWELAGKPAALRYTQDTNLNRYFSKPFTYYSRTTRAYVRGERQETSRAVRSPEQEASEGIVETREPVKIAVRSMEMLRPWVPDVTPNVSVSDHSGVLIRLDVEV